MRRHGFCRGGPRLRRAVERLRTLRREDSVGLVVRVLERSGGLRLDIVTWWRPQEWTFRVVDERTGAVIDAQHRPWWNVAEIDGREAFERALQRRVTDGR